MSIDGMISSKITNEYWQSYRWICVYFFY